MFLKYPQKNLDSSRYLVFFTDSSGCLVFFMGTFRTLLFSTHSQNFLDTIWIVQGVWFFHGYCLDSILGHRKMKCGQFEHLDRLLGRIQSGPSEPVWQIWVSAPVRSGDSYAESGQALISTVASRMVAVFFKTHKCYFLCPQSIRLYPKLQCAQIFSRTRMHIENILIVC